MSFANSPAGAKTSVGATSVVGSKNVDAAGSGTTLAMLVELGLNFSALRCPVSAPCLKSLTMSLYESVGGRSAFAIGTFPFGSVLPAPGPFDLPAKRSLEASKERGRRVN